MQVVVSSLVQSTAAHNNGTAMNVAESTSPYIETRQGRATPEKVQRHCRMGLASPILCTRLAFF
jgi:hypothetical protein